MKVVTLQKLLGVLFHREIVKAGGSGAWYSVLRQYCNRVKQKAEVAVHRSPISEE